MACIEIAGVVICFLTGFFIWLVWSQGPQIYSEMVTQIGRLTAGTILYVSPEGEGRTCASWAEACSLQLALIKARKGDEIWVMAGIHRPGNAESSPLASFTLKDRVAVYGGFAGTETARDQRDWKTNLTVLSGDLAGDDKTDPNGVVTDTADITGSNSYHVVTGTDVGATAILDGFTITAGYAKVKPPANNGFGGGMFNWNGSPTLTNLVFSGNTAGMGAAFYGGGGMFNIYSSNPILTDVTFVANTAGSGAGMYNHESSPTLIRVLFMDNKALDSGGMNNYSNSNPVLRDVTFSGNRAVHNDGGMTNHTHANPILTNVTFVGNSAGDYSGGMGNWESSPTLTDVEFSENHAGREAGGMGNASHSNPVLTNVTFVNNSAGINGGGLMNNNSRPTLTNVTFYGNSAGEYGGGICNTSSSVPTLTNVTIIGNRAPHGSGVCAVAGRFILVNGIVWGNKPSAEQVYADNVTPDITYSDIEGGFPGEGNLNLNPRLSSFKDFGGITRMFALLAGSPVIDRGSPTVCPGADQLSLPRPVDGDGNGSVLCDMGAFEYRISD